MTTSTPSGAIINQIDRALVDRSQAEWLKLYNSGNFFDPQSIPTVDYPAIARRCNGYSRVIVENHPRFGNKRLLHFRDQIEAQLEVAVGLETVQPRWLDRLGKKMTRDDFDRYATWLRSENVDLRVFLIVGVPGNSVDESITWAMLSALHAARAGARHISLIPARSGHGWNGQADRLPEISTLTLEQLHVQAIERLAGKSVVTVDLWDMDADDKTVQRISARNLTQCVSEDPTLAISEPNEE